MERGSLGGFHQELSPSRASGQTLGPLHVAVNKGLGKCKHKRVVVSSKLSAKIRGHNQNLHVYLGLSLCFLTPLQLIVSKSTWVKPTAFSPIFDRRDILVVTTKQNEHTECL